MKELLSVNSISKTFGSYRALDEVSLSIPKGSVFGLLGPNGAGKTTLIRIVNQISIPDSGSLWFDGEALKPTHICDIGYLPEERGLYKSMKVGEQAVYLAQLKGLTKVEAKQRLLRWFERLEIGDWWNKKIAELSKGMAQKIQFIVTVLHQPKLLIFDEPFSGFDPINANLIKNEILRLRDEGATIIFSTHRMESVEEMCDHIALINRGKKIIDGNLSNIKKQYRTNTFQLGLKTSQRNEVLPVLKARYAVSKGNFKTIENDLKLEVELKSEESPNELMALVFQHRAEITHFVEKIPTTNDIFIKSIGQNT